MVSLKPSALLDQAQLLKDDLDLRSLDLTVQGKASLAILEHVTDATVTRTIDGASTLTVSVRDRERLVWKSGYLAAKVDTQVDGLWFRLKAYDKQGDDLTLTFEDREVAILRDYPKPFDPHRYLVRPASTTTRLQFAELLVREVTEVPIRFVSPATFPALLQSGVLPVTKKARTHARGLGFAPGATITVKHHTASPEQKSNIDQVLQAGVAANAHRSVLVTAIMTITQESSALTSATNGVHVGLFQQDPRYWPATRDPAKDAAAFFKNAIKEDQIHPSLSYGALAAITQLNNQPTLYAQWKDEAERTVDSWGATSTSTSVAGNVTLPASADKSFQFTRGTLTYRDGKKEFTREDNWTCLQRLASEVNWRCFAVSGSVYFMPDLDLLASQPQMTLSEASEGVDVIDGSGDEGRQSIRKGHRVQQLNQQATIQCRIGRWAAPPGACVELEDSGPLDGRWLVASIPRSLFKPDATITLKRPQAALPEARAPEYLTPGGGQIYTPPTSAAVTPGGQFVAAGSLVRPIPKQFSRGQGGMHPTAGLASYPAVDYFASPGSPVVAPEAGKITRFSGHDPAVGPIGAPGGPLGWTIYLEGESGTSYFITHLATRTVNVGQKVGIATQIGTVADYDKWGRQSHTHVGVNGGTVTWEMLAAAPLAEKAVVNPSDALHHR